MILFAKSSVGYSHLDEGKPCQDASLLYQEGELSLIAVADGHGGASYIRSDRGSKFACQAVQEVFSSIGPEETIYPNKIKLQILCAWNALVERDYGAHPFGEEEFAKLDEDERQDLVSRPERAYGTTLMGAAKIGKRWVVAHIGDGESLVYKDGKVSPCFDDDDDEPVANVTYSMCNEDVLSHLKLGVIPLEYADFVLLCTDGAANPYQSYDNLCTSFVVPVLKELSKPDGMTSVEAFIDRLASSTGIGDDVSLGVIGLGPLPPEEEKKPEPAEEQPLSEIRRSISRIRYRIYPRFAFPKKSR
ncbi:MAG: protein phosphatase 2C domain-containing protein [Bacilli bacterium]|nr:protein phosphatase 2C domain-containing protein [Bacilli bacterium]